jgi:hypothetical protein
MLYRHTARRAVRDLRAYRRHELAHCNGWSHSHSGAHLQGFDDLQGFEAR